MKRKETFNHVVSDSNVQTSLVWQPPQTDYLKLNIDASVLVLNLHSRLVRWFVMIRDNLLEGKNMRILDKISVMEAEARGVQEAIS